MQKKATLDQKAEVRRLTHLYDKWTGVYSKPVHLSAPAAAANDVDDDASLEVDNSTNSPSARSTSLSFSSACK